MFDIKRGGEGETDTPGQFEIGANTIWSMSEISESSTPPMTLQREFALCITAVEKFKAAQRTSITELDALIAAPQHRAFRSEL